MALLSNGYARQWLCSRMTLLSDSSRLIKIDSRRMQDGATQAHANLAQVQLHRNVTERKHNSKDNNHPEMAKIKTETDADNLPWKTTPATESKIDNHHPINIHIEAQGGSALKWVCSLIALLAGGFALGCISSWWFFSRMVLLPVGLPLFTLLLVALLSNRFARGGWSRND
ncbi:hypothetical protein H9Q69_011038 [Fusarium xylarioides]|nr:hypothetical protein H9Q69_011038 [Fusarium xylarioides]